MRCNLNSDIIVKMAADIADKEGLSNLTLTNIAKSLNIKKQSLYNHIRNIAHLKCLLIIYANMHLREHLAETAIGKSKDIAVIDVANAYRQFAHNFPGQYQAIISLSWEYRDNDEFQQATKSLMDVLFKVLAPYDLHDEALIHAVRGFRSIMHGFVSLESANWFHKPLAKQESYLLLIQTFINGLANAKKSNEGGN
ncbi:TetR/AcrR family transcriptional regulator [Pectinatus brassicae]|uniref:AcrR family transcriptional regulator n=1 Tax=Pectinatus brassicae TaxID=862415 RepID=A0A840UXN4_9FIRM|nr:TetR-like C-terminal domain-containing protein [Pectinatus brassicae]MBB5337155.1 AcrR family transcriptional regulator [Pectinatus brassicae]